MNIVKVLKLLEKYNDCPNCGSEAINDGQNVLEITDQWFRRSCACGWVVSIDYKKEYR